MGVLQLSASPLLLLIDAVGAVIFCVISMVSVSVQPFEDVTVTVYEPGVLTDAAAALPRPLLQE